MENRLPEPLSNLVVDDDGLRSSGSCEKWWGVGHVLKTQPTWFPDMMDMGMRERVSDWKLLVSAARSVELPFVEIGKATGGTDLALGLYQEFIFGPVSLQVPVKHPDGDVK